MSFIASKISWFHEKVRCRWILAASGSVLAVAAILVGIWGFAPRYGKLSLYEAADKGDLKGVVWLLDHGDNINSRDFHDTALMAAAGRGHTEIVQYLVSRGADINAGREYGRSALILAICNHHVELAKWLIEHGADVNVKDKTGDTVLHYAARYGDAEIAELLIARGAAMNARGDGGRTPLFVTLAFRAGSPRNDISVAKVLLEHGADSNMCATTDIAFGANATPLHLASRLKSPELAELLKKHGAK